MIADEVLSVVVFEISLALLAFWAVSKYDFCHHSGCEGWVKNSIRWIIRVQPRYPGQSLLEEVQELNCGSVRI